MGKKSRNPAKKHKSDAEKEELNKQEELAAKRLEIEKNVAAYRAKQQAEEEDKQTQENKETHAIKVLTKFSETLQDQLSNLPEIIGGRSLVDIIEILNIRISEFGTNEYTSNDEEILQILQDLNAIVQIRASDALSAYTQFIGGEEVVSLTQEAAFQVGALLESIVEENETIEEVLLTSETGALIVYQGAQTLEDYLAAGGRLIFADGVVLPRQIESTIDLSLAPGGGVLTVYIQESGLIVGGAFDEDSEYVIPTETEAQMQADAEAQLNQAAQGGGGWLGWLWGGGSS